MFVVRFANLSLARYLTNPRVIAWLPALKGPLELRLLAEILLFWASLSYFYRFGTQVFLGYSSRDAKEIIQTQN